MFQKEVYIRRRDGLRNQLKGGIALILGNVDVPMNYRANTYRFRQDSNFLYFFGIDHQQMAGVVDLDNGTDHLFGNDVDINGIIWMGPQPLVRDKAAAVGVEHTAPFAKVFDVVAEALKSGRKVHFLPPYRAENKLLLEKLTGIHPDEQASGASEELIRAIVALRSVKDDMEIAELEKAMETAWLMHTTAMKMAVPGARESVIAGVVEGIAISGGGALSFPLILSRRGETLHNHDHSNILEAGDLLLVDGGCETPMHYASDHTRTIPVGGKFSARQAEIYQIVLDAQVNAIAAIKPGIPFRDIHFIAARTIASGLKSLGLMKGDVEEAVNKGAHALFFPHGLGHMLGMDVHDMEDLGENYVGYDNEIKRSDIFGTAFLRLGRRLEQGFVLTVEPGIYFIPALAELWEKENRFAEFIDYSKVKSYLGFGGIRIEDDVLVTADGYRVLGRPIPKTISEIESFMQQA